MNWGVEGCIRVAMSPVRQDGQDCCDRSIRQEELTESYSNQANRERFIPHGLIHTPEGYDLGYDPVLMHSAGGTEVGCFGGSTQDYFGC